MGAWIETVVRSSPSSVDNVAPFMGAWIETISVQGSRVRTVSLPSWERGLKPVPFAVQPRSAWSLPSWERGLKRPSSI